MHRAFRGRLDCHQARQRQAEGARFALQQFPGRQTVGSCRGGARPSPVSLPSDSGQPAQLTAHRRESEQGSLGARFHSRMAAHDSMVAPEEGRFKPMVSKPVLKPRSFLLVFVAPVWNVSWRVEALALVALVWPPPRNALPGWNCRSKLESTPG